MNFDAMWTPEPFSGCWLWTGRSTGRYGMTGTGRGKERYAHRISWEIHRGPIPKGKCVLHRCDTTHCVNPDHLFIGTKRDNTQDCIAKDRFPQGVKHWNVRLTPEQVREIRTSTDRLDVLAERYGISYKHACGIKARTKWKHL